MPDSLAKPKTVAILGAGPVGLAAAARVLERGMTPVVLEAGPEAAHAVRQWRHVRMFSPWEYNVDESAGRLLAATGWNAPAPDAYPTGGDLVDLYLEPLATRTPIKDHLRTNSRVTAVARGGFDKLKSNGRAFEPFTVRYRDDKGAQQLKADAVIDVTGTWFSPNPAGADGLPALGEEDAQDRVAYAMPDVLGRDRARYAGRTVAVLGAGHSAIGTLIDLGRLKDEAPETEVIWLLRGDRPDKAFGGGANDKLAARGALGIAFSELVAGGKVHVEAGFAVCHVRLEGDKLRVATASGCGGRHVLVDQLVVATGFRPSFDFLREVRLSLDPTVEAPPALAPLIDPNLHSCGTVRPHGARELAQPDPGFYIAGMKSYGRAPTFLMRTGYEQVRSIVAEIAGDRDAAARVELVLPETGVCAGPVTSAAPAASGCCGPAKPQAEAKKGCCG
ncbi:MAG: NAD(P)-binding domain-containing protein [Proteobacteria bacterium]|nr:NAD(P)-binding domain-containing protein [Pseudomonadota bacterium]